jgi:hypothetical protein
MKRKNLLIVFIVTACLLNLNSYAESPELQCSESFDEFLQSRGMGTIRNPNADISKKSFARNIKLADSETSRKVHFYEVDGNINLTYERRFTGVNDYKTLEWTEHYINFTIRKSSCEVQKIKLQLREHNRTINIWSEINSNVCSGDLPKINIWKSKFLDRNKTEVTEKEQQLIDLAIEDLCSLFVFEENDKKIVSETKSQTSSAVVQN